VTFLLCIAPAAALVPDEWTGNGNNLDLSKLQVGDLILCEGCAGWLAKLIPGWDHAAMYIGNGQIIEAWKDGVRVVSVDIVSNADSVAIYRVATSDSVKQAAVNWTLTKVGYPYGYQWLTYIGGKESTVTATTVASLYGQLILPSVGQIYIDENPGWSWSYGYSVAPQELADDDDTYLIDSS
jgi:uncharacterized protein YycO